MNNSPETSFRDIEPELHRICAGIRFAPAPPGDRAMVCMMAAAYFFHYASELLAKADGAPTAAELAPLILKLSEESGSRSRNRGASDEPGPGP